MMIGRVRLLLAAIAFLKRHALLGVGRTLRSYKTLIPVAVEYKHGLDTGTNATAMEAMHARNAPRVLAMIHNLKGLYTKVGQVLSVRTDELPAAYVAELSTLQDALPPRPFRGVRAQVRRTLGRTARNLTLADGPPLGVASIGQVHRARFGGRDVCVKVQDERCRRQFKSDMAGCRVFCQLFSPGYLAMLDEIRRQFDTEFDYRHEAANLDEIRANLEARGERRVVVPKSVPALVTRTVLGMEFLRGPTLLSYAKRRVAAIERLPFLLRAVPYAFLRLELGRYYRVLVEVHGAQLLLDGCFNGDPHPGNILKSPDGTLGLIDYGQVKRIDDVMRRRLCLLMVALADDDEDAVVDAFVATGFRTRDMNRTVIAKYAHLWFNRDDRRSTDGMEPMKYYDELNLADPTVAVPEQLILASRMTWLLRCFGQAIGVRDVRLAREFRATALAALRTPVMLALGPAPP